MSLCTVCGRYLCDHTAKERGQTDDEMQEWTKIEDLVHHQGTDEEKMAVVKTIKFLKRVGVKKEDFMK